MRTIARTTAAALVSMALVLPAFAQSSSSSSAGTATSADLACLSAAVDARENAVISARTTFNTSIMAALQTRRDALRAAYTIANNHDRMVAIDAALTAYAKATAAARAKFSADVKAAASAFATARVACHIDQHLSMKGSVHENEGNGHQNRGLHLGWLKNGLNTKASANAWMKLDLSF